MRPSPLAIKCRAAASGITISERIARLNRQPWDEVAKPLPVVKMSRDEFDTVPHFQNSVPIVSVPRRGYMGWGTWKRRTKKRHDCDNWILAKAIPLESGGFGIEWKRIEVVG
jgi:hypothetical protein